MQIIADAPRIRDCRLMRKTPFTQPIARTRRGVGGRIFATAIMLAALTGVTGPAAAQQEEEVWRILLREQLLSELKCQLNYTTNLRKFEIAGKQAVDVRAHCHDGRSYDASWRPDEERYEFKVCEPTAC
jgi:hypothetical protein